MLPPQNTKSRTGVRRGAQVRTDIEQAHINRQIHAELLDLDKHLAWNESVVLKEVRATRIDNQWRVLVKAEKNGKSIVSFVHAGSLLDALELTGWQGMTQNYTWRPDRFP